MMVILARGRGAEALKARCARAEDETREAVAARRARKADILNVAVGCSGSVFWLSMWIGVGLVVVRWQCAIVDIG